MPRIPIDNAAKTTLATIPDTREDNNTKLSVRKDNVLVSKQGALSRFFTLPSTVINNNQRIVDNFAKSIFGETEHLSKYQKDQIQKYWSGKVAHKHRITAGTLRDMQKDVMKSDALVPYGMQIDKAYTVAPKIRAILNREPVDQQKLDVMFDKFLDDEPINQQDMDSLRTSDEQKREDIIRCMMDLVHAEGMTTIESLNLITLHFDTALSDAENKKLTELFPDIKKDLNGIVSQRHNRPEGPPPVPPKKAALNDPLPVLPEKQKELELELEPKQKPEPPPLQNKPQRGRPVGTAATPTH